MASSQHYKNLDVNFIKRLRPTLGEFDTIALTAKYNFTFEEYQIGSFQFASKQQATEVIKTLFHETTHLYQILSTPFGYYCYTLRSFQSNQVAILLKMIKEKFNLKVKYPLVSLIESLGPKDKFPELWFNLHLWYLAEIILLYLEGTINFYFKQSKNNPLIDDVSFVNQFAEMDFYLSQYFAQTGRVFKYPGHNLNKNPNDQIAITALKAFGNQDVLNVMESWAKVSEYWEYQGDIDQIFPDTLTNSLNKYYSLIHEAKIRLKVPNFREFTLTFSAICELSLFGPILPQHSKFRNSRTAISDIHPLKRFYTALNTAKTIEPIRNLDTDYKRFVDQICNINEWPTPFEIGQDTLSNFHYFSQDILSELYHRANNLRMHKPSAFINLSIWYTPQDDFAKEFTYYFIHPVMEFRNRTLYHKNKAIVDFFVSQYIEKSLMRKLLISDNLIVTLPFKIEKAGQIYYENVMTKYLEMVAGIKNAKIILKTISSGNVH